MVAGEVKNLASQSANATAQISKEIEGMQAVSSNVAKSLLAIRESMNSVRSYVTATAEAIEEQSVVSKDMSTNMQGASEAVERVTRSIGAISAAITQVGRSVAETKGVAQTTLSR